MTTQLTEAKQRKLLVGDLPRTILKCGKQKNVSKNSAGFNSHSSVTLLYSRVTDVLIKERG